MAITVPERSYGGYSIFYKECPSFLRISGTSLMTIIERMRHKGETQMAIREELSDCTPF